MRKRILKFSRGRASASGWSRSVRRARLLALSASATALGTLALASPSMAIVSPPAGLPLAGQNCNATGNLPAPSATTADLPSGTATPTTLSVTATSVALTTGQVVTVQPANGFGPQQQFTLTADAAQGATSLSVSFTPSPTTVDYPVGSRVVLPGANNGSVVPSGPGKIAGRGATLPLYAVINYIDQFSQNVCGPVAADTLTNTYTAPAADQGFGEPTGDPTDPSSGVDGSQGTNPNPTYSADQMLAYNYPSAQDTSGTGSGQGRNAISCRTDAFSGSDIPYSEADLTNMDGAPGAEANAGAATTGDLGSCLKTSSTSPFQSTGASTDPAGKVMSFPIVGGAIALAVNLPSTCANSGGGFKFSTLDMAEVWSGNLQNWGNIDTTNDPNLTPTCGPGGTNVPITRVVRKDTSGTSQNFENYLAAINADTAVLPSGENLCGPLVDSNGHSFTGITSPQPITGQLSDLNKEIVDSTTANGFASTPNNDISENNVWPSGGSCNGLTTGTGSGTPSLLHALDGISGGIGYADVTDEVRDPGDAASLVTPQIEASDNSSYDFPTTGTNNAGGANCTYSGATLPGTGTADNDMGINGEWAVDASPNHSNVAFNAQGAGYPVCALTWEFVFEGDDGNATTTPSGNQGLLYPDADLTAALTSGTSYSSLSVTALPSRLFTGQTIMVGTKGNVAPTTQTWTLSANALPGATTISVTPQLANNNYPAGTSGVATTVLNLSSVPAGTPTQGSLLIPAGGTEQLATYDGMVGNQLQNVAGAVGPVSASTQVKLPSGTGGPEPELNPNQRMTLYSYMSYMLSSAAQGTDAGVGYTQLPAGWIDLLRSAFQTDY